MRRKPAVKESRKTVADALKDFSTGSKIQDALIGLLRGAAGRWLPRKDLVTRLVEAGALRQTTSSEVGRIQVQKALDALDKKLAQFNDEHGTSWAIERQKGKGLRLMAVANDISKSKSSVRQKLTAPGGAVLTVQRQRRSNGSFLVKVVHVDKAGAHARTGMVTIHLNEVDAVKRFEELVALAQESGWTLVARKKSNLPSSQFNEIPQAE
jgi:hypothetical protein